MPTFTAPQIQYGVLLPLIIVFAAACLAVIVEAVVPRRSRPQIQLTLTLVAVIVALIFTIANWAVGRPTIGAVGALSIDGPTYFIWVLILVLGGIALLTFSERRLEGGRTPFTSQGAAVPGSRAEAAAMTAGVEHTEVYPLGLFALSGMLLFPAANDLIMLFVALEVLSLPLYLLCGMARRRRLLSQEASMKYFLLGALSSAILLFGIAMIYGFTGSFDLKTISNGLATSSQGDGLLLAGIGLLAVGLLFKMNAAPFHIWTPDVYTGAPTVVTGFMAACTKIAAVGALMRIFYVALGGARWDWQPLIAVVAVASIGVGYLLAILQTDLKRMLAYSSIAHAGFILTAIAGTFQAASGAKSGQITSVAAVLFYLAIYGVATIGAFALITMVRSRGGEVTNMAGWAGLGRKSPLLAAVFSLFLFSFAGIPLTGGFIGKWVVFSAAWAGGQVWLVIVGLILSIIGAFFYVRVVIVMYVSKPAEGSVVVRAGVPTMFAVAFGAVATLALGIYPGPLMELAQHAGEFLR